MAKTVLVIGSSGSMGSYLVRYLSDMGYEITGVSLTNEKPYSERVRCIKADAFDKEWLAEILKQRFDGIVNFMDYGARTPFEDYYKLFLDNTDHYIYLSSCRVYADEEWPVKETSPRLLDVSKDEEFLATKHYPLRKARDEDLLMASGYQNFTIIRPTTILSRMQFPLVTLNAYNTVGRALRNKKVVLPIQAKDIPATLSWAGDVSMMIAKLLFNESAKREIYNVNTTESRTWGEIADIYRDICGLEAVWVDKEDYLWICDENMSKSTRWWLDYARLFHRIIDNTKVLKATGMDETKFLPLRDALEMLVRQIPENYDFDAAFAKTLSYGREIRMDEYLKTHNL